MKMIQINRIIKLSVAFTAIAASAFAVSCSEWTEPESIDFEEGIVEPSQEYLAALREYKKSDHKISMLMIELPSKQPANRNQHVVAMPDSADYICVRNAVNGIYPALVQEISQVRNDKGTEVLCEVNYTTVFEQWTAIEDAKENEPAGTEEEYIKFVSEKIAAQLECCDQYGFGGIMVTMDNVDNEFYTKGLSSLLEAIETWRTLHSSLMVILQGDFISLPDDSILDYSEYIVIPMKDAYSPSLYTEAVKLAFLGFDKGKDKVIIEVAVPNDDFPQNDEGKFKEFQPFSAAKWVNEPDPDFGRKGILISNVQQDYTIAGAYPVSRRAISLLNPSVAE
mgnify:FL=1